MGVVGDVEVVVIEKEPLGIRFHRVHDDFPQYGEERIVEINDIVIRKYLLYERADEPDIGFVVIMKRQSNCLAVFYLSGEPGSL